MASISEIEGIGASIAEKLKAQGVSTTEALLKQGASPAGRHALAAATGVREALILEWVNHADLERVSGIGWEYADLLEAAGVDSVPELAQRNGVNLHARLAEINATKNLVRRLPTEEQVSRWVTEAKSLPRVVES
jgi:predicted flap endonuclease-1-like 5' DNA nuclease